MSLLSSVCAGQIRGRMDSRHVVLSSRGRRVWADHPCCGHRRDDCIRLRCIGLVSAQCIVMLCHSGDVGCGPEGRVDECSLMWNTWSKPRARRAARNRRTTLENLDVSAEIREIDDALITLLGTLGHEVGLSPRPALMTMTNSEPQENPDQPCWYSRCAVRGKETVITRE